MKVVLKWVVMHQFYAFLKVSSHKMPKTMHVCGALTLSISSD